MRVAKRSPLILLVLLIILSFGCAKDSIVPESEFDSVSSHCSQGMRELEAGNLENAKWEFERANGIDREKPLPYVGLALVESEAGNRDAAFDYIDEALDKDSKCLKAYIARAKVRARFQEDDWYSEALEDLKKAKEIDQDFAEIYFTEAKVHEADFALDPAEKSFAKVLEIGRGFEKETNLELEKITKIKRAAPGSRIGIKIGLVDKITKGEAAVLFIEELKIGELLERSRPGSYDTEFKNPEDSMKDSSKEISDKLPSDIESHWARNYIISALDANIRGLGVYPDNTFRPDEYLSRAEYALVIEDILSRLIADEDLSTKYIGQPSPFPDVGSAHFASNAIRVCVERGIMKADLKDNCFHPNETVSGADALLMIKSMQDELRTVF